MLTFVIILACMSTAFEMVIAAKIPAWRRLAHKSAIFNLIASMLLSYIVGIAFGAQGLIAMTAGVLSTLLSVPGYTFLHWAYDSERAKKHNNNLIEYHSQKVRNGFQRWKQALNDLAALMYKIIKVITFPIWITRAIMLKLNKSTRQTTV